MAKSTHVQSKNGKTRHLPREYYITKIPTFSVEIIKMLKLYNTHKAQKFYNWVEIENSVVNIIKKFCRTLKKYFFVFL